MTRRSIDLLVATDPAWVGVILDDFDEFLKDHANCERKASALALSLVVKYPDRSLVVADLIGLAQEELEHFAQVYRLLRSRGLTLVKDVRDPYVNDLHGLTRDGRDERFLDRLLISSVIECRGAERFRIISQALEDPALKRFYRDLGAAEAKHGHQFVDWALRYFDSDAVYARLRSIAAAEAELISRLAWRPSLH
jgi:tRNA-(ms[2]io[6]A)-hydroxylase